MATLYILCGYPFAGKSTIARALIKKYGFVRVAIDDIKRKQGIGNDIDKEIAPEELQKTYDIYHDRIMSNLKLGKSVITDTVAHTRESRDGLRKIAKENNAETVILYVNTPLNKVKKRWMKNRTTQERNDVLDKDFNSVVNDFEVPGNDENVTIISNDMPIEKIYKLIHLADV